MAVDLLVVGGRRRIGGVVGDRIKSWSRDFCGHKKCQYWPRRTDKCISSTAKVDVAVVVASIDWTKATGEVVIVEKVVSCKLQRRRRSKQKRRVEEKMNIRKRKRRRNFRTELPG